MQNMKGLASTEIVELLDDVPLFEEDSVDGYGADIDSEVGQSGPSSRRVGKSRTGEKAARFLYAGMRVGRRSASPIISVSCRHTGRKHALEKSGAR
jgi:hypothetical protein